MSIDTKRKLVEVYVGECSMGQQRPSHSGGYMLDQCKVVPRESVHEYVAGEVKKLADKSAMIEVIIRPTADLAPAYAVKKGA